MNSFAALPLDDVVLVGAGGVLALWTLLLVQLV
jgi:hypothetical protein